MAHKRSLFSGHESLRKIKRFNIIVKHYFLRHHTVAFNSCRRTPIPGPRQLRFAGLAEAAGIRWPDRSGLRHMLPASETVAA
jgi:hypothetical protein